MRAHQWRPLPVIGVGVALAALLYLGGVTWTGGVQGFPLDDAWIHQTYARNLAFDGQWSYVPGRASTGSTSPLWTLALTPAYILGINHLLWTLSLGAAMLALVAWMSIRLLRRLFVVPREMELAVAAFCVLEWHLVWAAFSGMETLLYAALVLVCLDRYLAFEAAEREAAWEKVTWLSGLWMGLCSGLLVLTRPEGLLLLALLAVWFVARRWRFGLRRETVFWALAAAVGCLAFVLPYAVFNLRTAGFLFPTTFYAKQAEYHSMIESLSLPLRFAELLQAVWAGPQVLLVPGFLFSVGYSLKHRRFDVILLWVWWVCSVTLYAIRLPMAYQHGRYLIPTVPVFVILGVWGTWSLMRLAVTRASTRIVSRAWTVALAVVLVMFWIVGARAYAQDIRFIYGEMGAMAEWLAENTSPQSRLAVHDIGLVGYYLKRPFIDLAGLVTPEVIPFIDDEKRLLAFMETEGVDYVVVFPDWSDPYRRLVQDPRLSQVHDTGYSWTTAQGRRNLSAYAANWSLTR